MSAPLRDPASSPGEASLVSAARVLHERWLLIAASALACAAVAAVLAVTATKQYTSTASLLFRQSDLTTLIDPSAGGGRDPQRDQGTNLLLVTSTQVADRVRRALRLPEDASAVVDKVSVEAQPDADIIDVKSTDADPRRAAALANAFADQFVAFRREADRARIAEGETLLRRQLEQLPPAATAERAELSSALRRVTALRAVTTGDAEVVDRAVPASTASSPRPLRDIVLGLVIGLVLGLTIAFLRDLFDRRVKSVEAFEELYGLPALTAVPRRSRDPATARDRQAVLEPFRIAHNALEFLVAGRPLRVLLVTSAVPAEGKSTVATGLARAGALAGQRVVLVETDMRRPTFHEQFDLSDDPRGLTDVLVGRAALEDVLRRAVPGLPTLRALPSGPLPPNSAELLRSAEMGQVLADLSARFDLVILDAPPLLPVADTHVLLDSPQVDACLVVARPYTTTRDEVRRARAIIERHRQGATGLVVNGVTDAEGGYGYYGAVPDVERGAQSEPPIPSAP